MSMTPERWKYLNDYAAQLFGPPDDQLATLMDRAVEAGLPRISVTSDVGWLLKILASSTRGGLALELGTLAGYSGIWIARGLAPEGKLLTIEPVDLHADFAEAEFESAGLTGMVEVIRGPALEAIPALELSERSVDFAFLDAVKPEYPAYFEMIKPLMSIGGLLVADNVLGTGLGWLDEGYGTDEFNRAVAADPDFEATITPQREGLLIARRI